MFYGVKNNYILSEKKKIDNYNRFISHRPSSSRLLEMWRCCGGRAMHRLNDPKSAEEDEDEDNDEAAEDKMK